MNRRAFLSASAGAALAGRTGAQVGGTGQPGASLVGQPVDLASCGEFTSWGSREAALFVSGRRTGMVLREAPWVDSRFDFGAEWPEFRTITKVVVRYSGEAKSPSPGSQHLECWNGLSALQGGWESPRVLLRRSGALWTYSLPALRTCKLRIVLEEQKQAELESFEIYGRSLWRLGEVRIEWGHRGEAASYDGSLEGYNARIIGLTPFGDTRMTKASSWISRAGEGRLSGVTARVLYTYGTDVDRSILTVRTRAASFSFLPATALEDQPIDIPAFGAYVCNAASLVDRVTYRERSRDKVRIMDAVAARPEQTLEKAYDSIRAERATLSFVGVDSNSQKFGIAPDGHVVVGGAELGAGVPATPKFAVFFATGQEFTLFEEPGPTAENPFAESVGPFVQPKEQELEEGWLPVIVTRWSEKDVGFERMDFGQLPQAVDSLDESALRGNEPAVLISRLTIRNDSTVARTAHYYIRPYKPAQGRPGYGSLPQGARSAWQTGLKDACVTASDNDGESLVCYVDAHGKGALALEPLWSAVRYSVLLKPGERHTIHTVIPGLPPRIEGASGLRGLPYERLHGSLVAYWKARRSQGMQVSVPDRRVQELYDVGLQHFLLALTKDAERGESYASTATFAYGTIGSESSPIIQSLDMRGQHERAERCLAAFLSTQGETMPVGDYGSKEGGFYRFWPNYTVNQGYVLWTLAEHYFYTRDQAWLRRTAPHIVAGCDFIIRERKRTMKIRPDGSKPLTYGLAPAGCVADPNDWQYSFKLNGYFYLGLKKSAQALREIDPNNAQRIAAEAEDYLAAIRRALTESVILSPVMRLRDNTYVPFVPGYVGLRGSSMDVKDSVSPDSRHGHAFDVTCGAFHLAKTEVLAPDDPLVEHMLAYLEDRYFLFNIRPSRVRLERLSTDWYNLGGFVKQQPYYLRYQEAYLRRDRVPNFVRCFFNTLASTADPQTLTFQEQLDIPGGQPNKTFEEASFFHQLRYMLLMESGDDLLLCFGTPRVWLEDGKEIAVSDAPTYFGKISFRVRSRVKAGRIEAEITAPALKPGRARLRLRHPNQARLQRVDLEGTPWRDFSPAAESIALPAGGGVLRLVAYY